MTVAPENNLLAGASKHQRAGLAIQPVPQGCSNGGPKRGGSRRFAKAPRRKRLRRDFPIDIDAGHTLPAVNGNECM